MEETDDTLKITTITLPAECYAVSELSAVHLLIRAKYCCASLARSLSSLFALQLQHLSVVLWMLYTNMHGSFLMFCCNNGHYYTVKYSL